MSPELIADLKTLSIAAVIAWGLTEVIKPLFKQTPKRRSLLRFIALLGGGFSGWLIYSELGGLGGDIVGAALGTAAGALDALIVWAVKKRIKGSIDANKT